MATAKSKVMHGARAVLYAGTTALGIFNNVSYGIQYDVSPVFILGRFSAAELVYTGMEVVQVSASGFRVLDNGPHITVDQQSGSKLVPTLQELLTYEDLTLALHAKTGDGAEDLMPIMNLTNVKPVGFNTSVGARGLQEMSVTFMGLHLSDETADMVDESPNSTSLPGADAE
jgi:hypothetical protein